MNIEQLIEYVTREVLIRVKQIQEAEAKGTQGKAIIIGSEQTLISQCQNNLEGQYDVMIQSSYNMNEQYDRIVLANLDTDLLGSIALGLLGEKYPIIQDAIMKGKPIDIIEEGIFYKRHKHTCNPNFYSLLRSYEDKVQSFGIQIRGIDDDQCFENAVDKPINEMMDCRLVTENILKTEKAKGNKKLYIGKRTLITPLASDYARQHNMIIVKMRPEECK